MFGLECLRKLQRHRPELPKNGGATALTAERGARAEAHPVPENHAAKAGCPEIVLTYWSSFDLLDAKDAPHAFRG
jgi:hypothetical protein